MSTTKTTPTIRPAVSNSAVWRPLSHPLFRALWLTAVASNIGTWMHNVGADWLMTTLAPSPLMVGLMQTAENAPLFLLVLPAGHSLTLLTAAACCFTRKAGCSFQPLPLAC